MLKKLAGYAIAGILVFWLISDPSAAASAAHTAVSGLASAGTSLGKFVKGL